MKWFFPGLFGVLIGTAITALMLASTLATPSTHRGVFIKVFGVLLCFELAALIGVIVFIVLAETGNV